MRGRGLVENVIWGEGVGRKRQNTVIWGKGSKIAKKNRHMIFERFQSLCNSQMNLRTSRRNGHSLDQRLLVGKAAWSGGAAGGSEKRTPWLVESGC